MGGGSGRVNGSHLTDFCCFPQGFLFHYLFVLRCYFFWWDYIIGILWTPPTSICCDKVTTLSLDHFGLCCACKVSTPTNFAENISETEMAEHQLLSTIFLEKVNRNHVSTLENESANFAVLQFATAHNPNTYARDSAAGTEFSSFPDETESLASRWLRLYAGTEEQTNPTQAERLSFSPEKQETLLVEERQESAHRTRQYTRGR